MKYLEPNTNRYNVQDVATGYTSKTSYLKYLFGKKIGEPIAKQIKLENRIKTVMYMVTFILFL